MIDFSKADPGLLRGLSVIVDDLSSEVGLDADQVLVLGADCRDIIHSALGHEFQLRATSDTDIAIAVGDWRISDRIEKRYRRLGCNGIRYSVSGIVVDIMPFGGVESPSGVSHPGHRGEDLVVFGFSDVYDRAARLRLPSGAHIRIPAPAGYTALKLRAWIDRSTYGEDKDGRDLALAAYWYAHSSAISDRLYETDEGLALLEKDEWDVGLAATAVLARDAGRQLDDANRLDLAGRLASTDVAALARSLILPPGAGDTPGPARRAAIARRLLEVSSA